MNPPNTLATALLRTITELLDELQAWDRYERSRKSLPELLNALEATIRLYRTTIYPDPPTIRHAWDTYGDQCDHPIPRTIRHALDDIGVAQKWELVDLDTPSGFVAGITTHLDVRAPLLGASWRLTDNIELPNRLAVAILGPGFKLNPEEAGE